MNHRLIISLAAFVFSTFDLTFCAVGIDLPQQGGKLAADPAITWGKLDNGLRYALMPNQQPKDKVSIFLQVQAGSLEETDSQCGLAYFLEHMAFCGTTHYPPGQLGLKFKQLGLKFSVLPYIVPGYNESVYKLDLPDAEPETIATALGIMADWAGGMLLLPAEIDQEREGVLAELRYFYTPEVSIHDAIAKASYVGTIVGDRPPLAQPETVTNINQMLLKNYYNTWYRPEAMMLVVVGAIDCKTVAAQVQEKFGKLADRAPAQSRPDLTTLTVTNKPIVLVHSEPYAAGTEVLVQRVMVASPPTDNLENERDALCRRLAEQIFLRRIQIMVARDANVPLVNASMFSYDQLGFAHIGVRASARQQAEAIQALALVVTEYRRMFEFGPTDAELTFERKAIAADLDATVDQAPTRQNSDLAEKIKDINWSGWVIQSPAQRRDLLKPMLETITRDDIIRSLNAYRSRPGRDVVAVAGQEDLGADGEQTVHEAYAKAIAAPVSAPVEGYVNAWAYGDLPESAGMYWITERPAEAALGIRVLWSHPNGLRMQVRRSDVQPDQVFVSLRFDITDADIKSRDRPPGVGEMIERGLVPGGLGRHTADEVTALFDDSSVRFTGVHVSDDAITYTATCHRNDLTRALQLLRAYFGDPGWRQEAEAPVKQIWLDSLGARKQDVDAQVERRMETVLAGPHAWRRPATEDEVKSLNFAKAEDWLNQALNNDTLTITVVGDVPTNAVDTVALWFGQYHVKTRFMQASVDDARASALESPPLQPGVEHLTVDSLAAKAVIHVVWPTDDAFDITRTHRLNVLARCFGECLRVTLRQKLGTNLTVTTWNTASETFRHEGQIHVLASVTPEHADQALSLIRTVGADLAEQGIDDKLLEQVRIPLMKSLQAKEQGNEWWFSTVLPYAGWQPFRIFWAASIEQDYQAITTSEVNTLAKHYLVDSNVFAIVGVSFGNGSDSAQCMQGSQSSPARNGQKLYDLR